MGTRARKLTVVGLGLAAWGLGLTAQASLPPPGFHHLHLNSVNPDAAIDFYLKAFPSTSKITFAGQPALASPNNVLVLFYTVATPPAANTGRRMQVLAGAGHPTRS